MVHPLCPRAPQNVPHGACWHPTALGSGPARALALVKEAGAGPCRYMAFCRRHPQENQRAALNEALCSWFLAVFFFFFPFPLPSPPQLFAPFPLRSQLRPRLRIFSPFQPLSKLWARGTVLPNPKKRSGRPHGCPTAAQSRNGALQEFPNPCLEQRELCSQPSGSPYIKCLPSGRRDGPTTCFCLGHTVHDELFTSSQ